MRLPYLPDLAPGCTSNCIGGSAEYPTKTSAVSTTTTSPFLLQLYICALFQECPSSVEEEDQQTRTAVGCVSRTGSLARHSAAIGLIHTHAETPPPWLPQGLESSKLARPEIPARSSRYTNFRVCLFFHTITSIYERSSYCLFRRHSIAIFDTSRTRHSTSENANPLAFNDTSLATQLYTLV